MQPMRHKSVQSEAVPMRLPSSLGRIDSLRVVYTGIQCAEDDQRALTGPVDALAKVFFSIYGERRSLRRPSFQD
jgi:hypothetical protein